MITELKPYTYITPRSYDINEFVLLYSVISFSLFTTQVWYKILLTLKLERVMVFTATFNNISVISWLSVLFVMETEKTTDLSEVTDKLAMSDIRTHNFSGDRHWLHR